MGRIASFAAALSLFAAGCGIGGVGATPTFAEGVLGPSGGSMAAGGVVLILPPGALTTDTIVKILAQPDPLPIDPAAPPITPMPGFMCIGPIGLDLVAPGHVRFCYDPATIPVGSTEADIVLLLWDADAGILRVSQTATHDVVAHCFDDIVYGELGHIGVGAVTGDPAPDFVFAANPLRSLRAVPGQMTPTAGLVLASSTGALAPAFLPSTVDASSYVASPEGARVLWQFFDSDAEATTLFSSVVADGTRDTVLDPSAPFLPFDPLVGFLSSSRVWHAYSRFDEDTNHDTFRDVGASGLPAATSLYDSGSPFGDLVDVRLSPDEAMVLLRYREFGKGVFDTLVVIDATDGTELGASLPGVDDPNAPTPRWLPDSSGLYYVDLSGQTVSRVDPDGSDAAVLYTMPPTLNSFLQDFVVAPSFGTVPLASTPCAYYRGRFSFIDSQGGGGGDPDSAFFVRDVLGGGALAESDLGIRVAVVELIYHPDGATVISDVVEQSLLISAGPVQFPETVRIHDATSAAQLHVFVASLSQFDLSPPTGELVVWFPTGGVDPAFPSAGLFRLEGDGDTVAEIDTNGIVPTGPARWLRSWRRTPSEFSALVR